MSFAHERACNGRRENTRRPLIKTQKKAAAEPKLRSSKTDEQAAELCTPLPCEQDENTYHAGQDGLL